MIGIAAVIIVLVVIFAVAVVVSNAGAPVVDADGALQFSIFGAKIAASVPGVFFTGAAVMLVLLIALWLLSRGLRRMLNQRKRIKSLKVSTQPSTTTDSGKKTPELPKSKGQGPGTADKESTPEERAELIKEVDESDDR